MEEANKALGLVADGGYVGTHETSDGIVSQNRWWMLLTQFVRSFTGRSLYGGLLFLETTITLDFLAFKVELLD